MTSVSDTQDETILPGRRHRAWTLPLLVLSRLLLLAVVVASLLPSSLVASRQVQGAAVDAPYALTPRTATPVDDRVSFGELEGVADLDTDRTGDFYFVTVSEPAQSVLGWWAAGGDPCNRTLTDEEKAAGDLSRCDVLPQIDFMTKEDKFGTQTPDQRRSISLRMMRTSAQVAQYVALRTLGYEDATLQPGEVVVGSLVEGAPAAEQLQVGDTIERVDGAPVGIVDDLSAALAGKSAGDVVTLEIDRPGEGEMTLQVPLTTSPDDPSRTIIGFVPFDTATVSLPFEVDIDTGQIGGPSAGLAFTLTLIDELSPGNLTGGQDIAVTGEIELDGSVGAIGGLAQKVSAVRQAGVAHFIVPAAQGEAQLERARQIAGDEVEIIPVATLDEALAALERLGGDPLPPRE